MDEVMKENMSVVIPEIMCTNCGWSGIEENAPDGEFDENDVCPVCGTSHLFALNAYQKLALIHQQWPDWYKFNDKYEL